MPRCIGREARSLPFKQTVPRELAVHGPARPRRGRAGAEWPRLGAARNPCGADARRRRERAKRKASLRVVEPTPTRTTLPRASSDSRISHDRGRVPALANDEGAENACGRISPTFSMFFAS